MSTVTLTSWTSLLDASGDPGLREVSVPPGSSGQVQAIVAPRVTTPPNAMPITSGTFGLTHEFANEQTLAPGGGTKFDTVGDASSGGTGVTELTDRGARIGAGGYLSGGAFLIGTAHYWEEGVIFLEDGALDVHLGTDPGAVHRGRTFVAGGATPQFKHALANAAGTGVVSYTFDAIDVPVSSFAPGQVPVPIYYRLVRNFTGPTGGEIHLRVTANGQTQEQTITGVDRPNATGAGTPRLGSTVGGGVARILWWRAQGSEVFPASVDFGQSSFWSAPEVYPSAPQQYASHGTAVAGFLAAGVADAYWRSIRFPRVLNRAGAVLEARFAAANTITGVSALSLMSGAYAALFGTVPEVDLEDIQGRYLAFELRFTPGTAWTMRAGDAVFTPAPGAQAIDAVATWADLPRSDPLDTVVELTFNSEGASEASLPYPPEVTVTTTERFRSHSFAAEAPYTIRRPLATRGRSAWVLRWVLTAAEFSTLYAFLTARRGGAGSFSWLPRGEAQLRTASLVDDAVQYQKLAPNAFEVVANVEEVIP